MGQPRLLPAPGPPAPVRDPPPSLESITAALSLPGLSAEGLLLAKHRPGSAGGRHGRIVRPLMLSDCSFVRLEAPSPRRMHGNSSGLQWGAAGSDLKANIDLKISVNQAGTPDLLGNTALASLCHRRQSSAWLGQRQSVKEALMGPVASITGPRDATPMSAAGWDSDATRPRKRQ